MNKRIVQNKQDSKNFILCFEKKKKASPTIEYIFTNVPSNMTNAAQKSFFFSIKAKANRIKAATDILNCWTNWAVINSI